MPDLTATYGVSMDNDGTKALVQSCIVYEEKISHSGLVLPWWCDLLRVINDFDKLTDALFRSYPLSAEVPPLLKSSTHAGIELGGYLLAATNTSTNVILVRKDGSLYGATNTKQPIILIDDVVTTGNSMIAAEKSLKKAGLKVVKRVCILDRREEFVPDAKSDFEIRSLFTTEELMGKGLFVKKV